MITTVYFVRHAQPDLNIHNDLERPLTEQGLNDREKLVSYFRDKKVDVAYSSPFKRARDTIEPVVKNKELSVTLIEDFRERKIGDEWIPNFHEYCEKQWENKNYKLNNGESLRETQNRNVRALEKVLKDNLGKVVLIGGHGTAIGTLINYFDSSFDYAEFVKLQPIMPFVVKMKFSDLKFAEWRLISLS